MVSGHTGTQCQGIEEVLEKHIQTHSACLIRKFRQDPRGTAAGRRQQPVPLSPNIRRRERVPLPHSEAELFSDGVADVFALAVHVLDDAHGHFGVVGFIDAQHAKGGGRFLVAARAAVRASVSALPRGRGHP